MLVFIGSCGLPQPAGALPADARDTPVGGVIAPRPTDVGAEDV